jgi:hypothetical protein
MRAQAAGCRIDKEGIGKMLVAGNAGAAVTGNDIKRRDGCGQAYWMFAGAVIAPRSRSSAPSASTSNSFKSDPTLA